MKAEVKINPKLEPEVLELIKSYLLQFNLSFEFKNINSELILEFYKNQGSDNSIQLESLRGEIQYFLENQSRFEKLILDEHKGSSSSKFMNTHIENHLLESKQILKNSDGLYSYTGEFLNDLELIDLWFEKLFISIGAQKIKLPSLISNHELAKTNIPKNFSNYLLSVNFQNTRTHYCRSATCVTCYPLFQNQKLDASLILTSSGSAFRDEASNEHQIFRLKEFTLREIILIGSPTDITQKISAIQKTILDLFKNWDLTFKLKTAFDHFALDKVSSLSAYQLLRQNKLEFLVDMPYLNTSISVASINIHETTFTKSYNITDSHGQYLNSACFGIGVERLILSLYSQFGYDKQNWPLAIKTLFKKC